MWNRSSKDGTHYEYIAVYVNNLAIHMKGPQAFCDTLKEEFTLKLNVLDHSAIIFFVDIPEMKMELLLQTQGSMLVRFLSPMKECWGRSQRRPEHQNTISSRDHPEIDLFEFCDQDQIKQYQQSLDS